MDGAPERVNGSAATDADGCQITTRTARFFQHRVNEGRDAPHSIVKASMRFGGYSVLTHDLALMGYGSHGDLGAANVDADGHRFRRGQRIPSPCV